MKVWFYVLVLIYLAPASAPNCNAQPAPVSSTYDAQIAAIEEMIAQQRYRLAAAQSQALIEEGNSQRLPNLEAHARYLHARSLLANPKAGSAGRIEGVRELQRAARGFSSSGMMSVVDSIARRITEQREGAPDSAFQLPPLTDLRQRNGLSRLNDDALEDSALGAIVALQDQRIEALTDSQLRQVILLQQKDMAIDSLEFQFLNDSLLLLQQELELKRQRNQVRNERQRRNFLIVLSLGVAIALLLVYLRYRSSMRYRRLLSEKNQRIESEQRRSDELLLNILPAAVARELKDTGQATARRYESVTVVFVDFVGFSSLAGSMEPEELVRLLDRTFRAIDQIVLQQGLEKIKTIGDAYLCVSGLPKPDKEHADHAVAAALAIQAYLEGSGTFRARIGIHSGPVVAGVVGRAKFAYDIWGDTVNQAARLEEAGQPGEVYVSATTCALLSDDFECIHEGTFEAKNIGMLDSYSVRARRLMKNPS
jgi:class 3 adenylate cyclase